LAAPHIPALQDELIPQGARRLPKPPGVVLGPSTGVLEIVMAQRTVTPPAKRSAASGTSNGAPVTREKLVDLLNQDLAREYQAIIAYVVYSQVLKGAKYMTIAKELEKHAHEELDHAIKISNQIDYFGGMPTVTAETVQTSEDADEMLRFDLDNENVTVRNYRERLRQCEALGEYATAEVIRQIIVQEQEHQIDLATALGEDVPDVSSMSLPE
jgi:bacterioferritin